MFDKHVFFFILSKITMSYKARKNPAWQDSPPAAGRASDILPFRCSAIRAERFLSYGNEVSYTIRKPGAKFPVKHRAFLYVILSEPPKKTSTEFYINP